MIQRIQSLYLSLTIILPLLFLKGSFLKFINKTGSVIIMNFSGTLKGNGAEGSDMLTNHLPLSVVIVLIPVFALIALFSFKDRKLQLKITLALILATLVFIGLIVYYGYSVINEYQTELVPGYKMFIPLVMLVMETLALRGIKKDENLVRSYDRLR